MKYSLFYLLLMLSIFSCNTLRKMHEKEQGSISSNPSNTFPKSTSKRKKDQIIKSARSYIGTPYLYGGINKKGMDCSGLIYTSCKEHNFMVPRISRDQSKFGKRVYIGELKEGDWIFFGASKGSKKITHVGMVTQVNSKNDMLFIHASSSRGVMESNVFESYWRNRYIKAIRPGY